MHLRSASSSFGQVVAITIYGVFLLTAKIIYCQTSSSACLTFKAPKKLTKFTSAKFNKNWKWLLTAGCLQQTFAGDSQLKYMDGIWTKKPIMK